MSRKHMFLVSTLAVACLWLVGRNDANAAQQEPIRIEVIDYPRPVAAAVLQIESQFGLVVTYEDTSYVHPSDIVDATDQVSRDRTTSRRVFQMRNGNIDFTYTPRPGRSDSQLGDVLRGMLEQSSLAGNTGEFRVDSVRGGYHVVPVATKGKSGLSEPYASPLEARITLSQLDGTGLEVMERLAEAISISAGRKVTPGTMPLGRFHRARVAVAAQNEPARDVLWRVMQSVGPDLSWQLLCSVGEKSRCAINIHPVRKKSPQ